MLSCAASNGSPSHSAEDIAKLMPEEYSLGNLPVYVRALAVSKPMYSPDSHFEPGAADTAYAVLKVFDPAVAGATIDLSKTFNDTFVKKALAGNRIVGHERRAKTDTTPLLPENFSRWFSSRGWTPRGTPARLLGARPRRPFGAADRADRRRQDAGWLSADAGGTERWHQPRQSRSAASTAHALHLAAEGAGGRHRAQSGHAGRARWACRSRIETRTGDTPASKRQRQRRDPPDILLTTPEQLALLLASADAPLSLRSLARVVLDELHALVTSKRGDLLALGSRGSGGSRRGSPTIGLSATVARAGRPLPLPGAAAGARREPRRSRRRRRRRQAEHHHAGARRASAVGRPFGAPRHPEIYEASSTHKTTLLFVNTRSQAEMMFQELWRHQ